MNQLILGDCLEVMRKMESESIDLIYLDPPFFSNRNYEVIWGDKGEIRSFEDRWSGGIDHYISWLKKRVVEMHRLLKPTGSIYLHCDWHANAEIKVLILNKIFGESSFINEIIWSYKRYTAQSKKFQSLHDNIYWYAKNSKNYCFNEQREEYGINSGKMDSHYKQDEEGQWFRLQKRKGVEPYKIYLSEGRRIGDVWEMAIINSSAKERIGYPTQKPEKLLERIINASSNEGDVVLDPFVGGGTTVVVADNIGRNWIGIDQSVQAIKVSEMRLNNKQNLFSQPFTLTLHKYDYDTLFRQDPKIFEIWIVERFGGRPNSKRGGDKGIDGKMLDGTPIQVKQSESIASMPIRQLVTDAKACDRNLFEKNVAEGKPVAYFIAFSYGKGAIQEVARLKNEEGVIIKLLTVGEIIPIAKKPKIKVDFINFWTDAKGNRDIQFTATAESENEIEMFAWDWDYDETKPFQAEVILDKTGKQNYKFKPGTHTIAVKAVDSEGLEALEIIKLKVNGVVERE